MSPIQTGRLAVCLACLLAAEASATPLVSSSGFEPPAFSAGSLVGQDGWEVGFLGNTDSTAVVQSSIVESGTSALRVDRASSSASFWAKDLPASPTGRFVSIDWDMYVQSTGSLADFGPFFGVQVVDDLGPGQVAQLGSLGVDASTGEIIYEDDQGFFRFGQVVELDQWHHFRIELDFLNQSYRGFVGEQVVAQSAFKDTTSSFTNADIVARASDGSAGSAAITGVGYFDNYLVRDGLRGDYNNNGRVDAADYTLWRDSLNSSGTGLAADGNADGIVDSTDYLLWQQSYGTTNVIPASLAVPEPATLVGVLCGLFALPSRGPRSSSSQ